MKYISLFIILIVLAIVVGGVMDDLQKPHVKPVIVPQNTATPTPTIFRMSVGEKPTIPFHLPKGFSIHTFASGLGSPRTLMFTPGGTLLVSDPTTNQVIALPDKNHDGVADAEKVIISDENRAHGLAFYNNKLYVADVDKVVRYKWDEDKLEATKDKILFSLPPNNDHNNRSIVFNQSGQMFISLGSSCNVCGDLPSQGGSVLVSDENGALPRVFAMGLRNAAFLVVNPTTRELWGTEMGRDNLGDNIPPDEINIIRQGQSYGWPFCYGNKIRDKSFEQDVPYDCNYTDPPIYQIPAHSAPLGLAFIYSPQFPLSWQGDLLVAYHGDWNRSTPSGYKVVHLKVSGDTILGSSDFLTGFLLGTTKESSAGRPVGLAFDTAGNLYLSDDQAGNVYIIQKQ